MLSFKAGAQPHLNWAMTAALLAVERILGMRGVPLIITAGIDGHHMEHSKHIIGLAFDCRSRDLNVAERAVVLGEIQRALGPAYDVLLEASGTDAEHFHVEYDPI
jgi:hypothetical protein